MALFEQAEKPNIYCTRCTDQPPTEELCRTYGIHPCYPSGPVKYRRVVTEDREAMRWTGDNLTAIQEWIGSTGDFYEADEEDRSDDPEATGVLYVAANSVWVGIVPGEWIIKDTEGYYPCKADVFAKTYEVA